MTGKGWTDSGCLQDGKPEEPCTIHEQVLSAPGDTHPPGQAAHPSHIPGGSRGYPQGSSDGGARRQCQGNASSFGELELGGTYWARILV